ncbi:uncharacterized protein LOC135480770 [Liolophura sinensis]|uniref:uncharacterized protein LOC135480770 n=1 Tax=Liolophura sinensis TaxID=3198878 RepID=UPI0031593E67
MFTLNGLMVVLIISLVVLFQNVRGEEYHQCTLDMAQDFRACFNTFGFGSGPTDGFTPRVNAFISYCSAPGRTNGEHCVNDFSDTCPRLFLAPDPSTFRKRQQLASRTLDYVCSNINVLENKIDCVEGKMRNVNRCVRDSVEIHTMQMAAANTTLNLDNLQDMMMNIGRDQMGCFVDILRETCGSAVSNLLANFIYGFIVYPYEDH